MNRREAWQSANRIDRRDNLRRVIRELGGRHNIDLIELGRAAGYISPSRWSTMMKDGEISSPSAADVLLLSSMLGGSHELLEEMARAAGFRLVPEAAAAQSETDVDAAASTALRDLAQLVARVIGQSATITSARAAEIGADLDEVRRSLGKFEAAISYSVVQPPTALEALRSRR